LIEKHSNENDLILDCFAGSFATAVACINKNRNFIGCELDKTYFQKSKDRLNKLMLH
jgi:DNA modification methylase